LVPPFARNYPDLIRDNDEARSPGFVGSFAAVIGGEERPRIGSKVFPVEFAAALFFPLFSLVSWALRAFLGSNCRYGFCPQVYFERPGLIHPRCRLILAGNKTLILPDFLTPSSSSRPFSFVTDPFFTIPEGN